MVKRNRQRRSRPQGAKILPVAAPLAHGYTSIAFRLPLAGGRLPLFISRQLPPGRRIPAVDAPYAACAPAYSDILLT